MARAAYNNRAAYAPAGMRNASYDNQAYGHQSRPQRAQKKHSGAKFKRSDATGHPCTTGWNKSRAGFFTFLCVCTKASKEGETQYGKWVSVMCIVQNLTAKTEPQKFSGMMNPDTGRVTISDLNMVLNPAAPNGGYCGRKGKKGVRY